MCPSGDSPGTITGNKVHGAVTGYKVTTAAMRSNVAEDCSGTGFTCSDPSWTSISSQNDIARRCGGYGFDFNATHGTVNMLASIADTIAGVGMHVASGLSTPTFIYSGAQQTGSHGIWFENGGMVKGCGAVRAGGYGILNTLGRVDSNVVGRCALTGIRAREARQNTSYLNLGSGFQILGPVPDTISLNIAYGNSHYGVEWLGSGTPVRKCNDWYANTLGATSGTTPGLTDLAVDPKFCNLPNDDVRLSATSPLLAVVGCGRIGPRGQGCSVPTGVVNDAASEDGAMTIRPNPSPGGIEIAFARSATASRVEVYDLAGARRFSAVVDAGATRFHWNGQDERGLPVPAGVYFVRHETGGRQQTARVVLAR